MKRNNLFLPVKINNEYFLLPTGQANAEHRKSIRLNSVGMFVWDALENDISVEHLMKLAIMKYNPEPEELPILLEDIIRFTEILKAKGLIENICPVSAPASSSYTTIKIAGIKIKIPEEPNIMSEPLNAFICDANNNGEADINVGLRTGKPQNCENGTILVRNREVIVFENTQNYVLIYLSFKRISEMHISKDYKYCDIFVDAPFDDILCHEFYLALRTPFLLKALSQGMIMLHSSSILYKNKLYCFSAPSRTGKSTHTRLWNRLFDTPVINGDTNLLLPVEDKVLVPGTPWCGTSEIFDTETHYLGGIVFLNRGITDEAKELPKEESFIKSSARVISPSWNRDFAERIAAQTEKTINLVPCWSLCCTPNDSAVDAIKVKIDNR